MMTNRRIMNYVNAEPFRPFQIRMTSGETYDIPHPEMIFVSRTTARVFTHEADGPQVQEQEISILLIEAIELLDASVPSDQDQE